MKSLVLKPLTLAGVMLLAAVFYGIAYVVVFNEWRKR